MSLLGESAETDVSDVADVSVLPGSIPRAPRGGPVPLSSAQERLWFLEQLQPGDTGYLIHWCVRLRGRLDLDALRAALDELVARHDALRTTFPSANGMPEQQVAERIDVPWMVCDNRTHLEAFARATFDLETGPLLRVGLLREGTDDHLLLLTVHHIVFDGWSLGVLTREWGQCYRARTEGGRADLPILEVEYADYAVWQRRRADSGELDEQLDYWGERLAGAPLVLELPTDRPRPAVQSAVGGFEALDLPEQLPADLNDLCREAGVTLFTVLLAAFELLLARHSARSDLLVGVPVAGRDELELEPLVGLFVNTLVLRGDLDGDPTVVELLERTQDGFFDAYAHQELPFERLVEDLRPERDLSRSPLIQAMFSLYHAPGDVSFGPELALERADLDPGASMFDLSLFLEQDAGRIVGGMEYRTDLFEPGTVRGMLDRYRELLSAMTREPGAPISALELLPEDERTRLRSAWNDTGVQWPDDACLHELFEAQAARTPDAVAVEHGSVSVTYRELNARADRLARWLTERGAGRGVVVGVSLPRCVDLLVALLAVLKSGGAYLPLDPAYPQARRDFALQDCAALLVLDEPLLSGALAEGSPDDTPRPPRPDVSADDPAYVIYTSGSTGVPKGVVIGHRSISNLIRALTQETGLGPADRLLAVTTMAFDIAAFELFGPLSCGAAVVIADREAAVDGVELARLLRESDAGVMQATPSTWRMLFDSGWTGRPELRVLCGGEALTGELAERLVRATGTVWNVYGPTETTVWSLAARLDPQYRADSGPVPIGRPLANTRLFVVDDSLRLCPTGVPGELLIGGVGVAKGYVGREDLTAQRFIADPFTPEPDSLLYRTGDVVRRRPDGTLDFLGRKDHQVKLRGFRIEPGEIEAVLARCADVASCVVVLRTDEPGQDRLVAYYTVTGASATPDHLREQLRATLPEYMIPSAFVELPRLPLTDNGKIDRKALPRPRERRRELDEGFEAPRDAAERIVAGAFAAVLGLSADEISAHDDFFLLGGHSLLATRLVARLRAALHPDLTARDLFQHPTVAALADFAGSGTAAEPEPGTGASSAFPVSTDVVPPLTGVQEQLWFLDALNPADPAYNLASAWRWRGALDRSALGRALGGLTARHQALRTSFPATDDGVPTVAIAAALAVEPRYVDLADAAERLDDELGVEAVTPFDLARGPLVRAALFRLADDEHVLMLTAHHIVVDGWSVELLRRDLARLYTQEATGAPAALPPLPVQFGDFASWQRQRLASPDLEPSRRHWAAQLAGVSPLDLPTDRPRPEWDSSAGATHAFRWDRELVDALRRVAAAEGATLHMVLMAAFQALLARHTSQRDFVVGTPIAGRPHQDLDEVVGSFATMLPMRARLDGNPAFREIVHRVKETALRAYEHQELPFAELVKSQDARDENGRSDVFRVTLALQNYRKDPDTPPATDVGHLTSVDIPITRTHFDLSLYLTEDDGCLSGWFSYRTDLWDAGTIAAFADRFAVLATAATQQPTTPLSQLPVLTGRERQLVLKDWAAPAGPPPSPADTLTGLLTCSAREHPDSPALVKDQLTVTYQALDSAAGRLARRLRELGVARDQRVAVCHADQAVAILAQIAVLKAGGAYLPLDPDQPPARLVGLLEDAEVIVLLTDREHDASLSAYTAPHVVLDAADLSSDPNPDTNADTDSDPEHSGPTDLAYVIYTSGSTGKPKGVAVQHREIVNYLAGAAERLRIVPGASYGLMQALCYDFSMTALYLALTTGGRLHLLPRHSSGIEVAEAIQRHGIDYLKLTPSHLAALTTDATAEQLLPRRALIFGGEASSHAWARELARLGRCAVFNHYGPTEASVGATVHEVLSETPEVSGDGNTPIGRPLPGATAYVLDDTLEPVPPGVVGELFLGGARLARGYLGRPELTAERFPTDRFSTPGARMYRTGDRARWRPDGTLDFLGRLDDQVKIRGHRVEPGEIEAELARLPGVTRAVVLVRGEEPNRRLVAYLERPGVTEPLDPAGLRTRLLRRLPEHMVPARFVSVERIPLQGHGKVDRAALPSPDSFDNAAGSSHPRLEPTTPAERTITAIWSELLGAEPGEIGALDDFFLLGGHSLLATRVVAGLRRAFPQRDPAIRVTDLFEHPTVRALARLVERDPHLNPDRNPADPANTIVGNPPRLLHRLTAERPTAKTLISVPYAAGSALVYRPLAQALPADWSLYSVAVPGHELGEQPRPLTELAEDCVREIRDRIAGPVTLYGHSAGAALAVEIARGLEAAGVHVESVWAAASLPAPRRVRQIWRAALAAVDRLRGDKALAGTLWQAGVDPGQLDPDHLAWILASRRAAWRETVRYYSALRTDPRPRLAAPVISIVGDQDPATHGHRRRAEAWYRVADHVTLVVLRDAGHYFVSSRAADVASLLAAATTGPLCPGAAPTWHIERPASRRSR